MITWHDQVDTFKKDAGRLHEILNIVEDYVESHDFMSGFCIACNRIEQFKTSAGVFMGEHVSLREGMICQGCGISSRSRLLFEAVIETLGDNANMDGLLLESISPMARKLSAQYPNILCSEYLGPGANPGSIHMLHGSEVRHESLLELSCDSSSLDVLIHNDILEHIYDVDTALNESMRVLRIGGTSVFVMPFFPFISTTQVRGRQHADGSIENIEEPEYHGDGVTQQGIYTFYHFGLDFIQRIREAGYKKVEIGLAYDVFLGYLSTNYRYGDDGIVLPIVFRATKL